MQRLLAIVWLTWKAALRFKLFLVIAVLLLAAVVGLPILIKDDGTARGFTQIILTYTLSAVTGLLGISTLWLSCGTLARDIEECQIQVVATKPIARWQIWLGKWLGLVLLNAVLLTLSGACIFGLLQWRATKLPPEEQTKLRNEVLVARGSAKEPDSTAELNAVAERILQGRLKNSPVEKVDVPEVRRQIREGVKADAQLVLPNYQRVWQIDLGFAKNYLHGKPLQLRVKFNAAQKSASGTFVAMWQVGVPEKTKFWQSEPMSLAPDTFHEFAIPADMFDTNGLLTITFGNPNNTALLFPLDEGMEVLYPEGSFALNFARGLGIIFCWMALLAAMGLCAASFLSFPVATFFALSLMLVVLSSGTLAESVESGSVVAGDEESGVAGHSFADAFLIPSFKGVLVVVSLAKNFSPIDSLSSGRSITWGELGLAVTQIIFMLGGIFAVAGIFSSTAASWRPRRERNEFARKKILLVLLAAALLFGSGRVQKSLNHDRDALGLTHTAVLENAPPMLAFTTVALGGFRGLISNFLWIRANDLQQDDKFFEAAQLADWITKLEPTFTQVWLFQGWNMAYNISVKFKENGPGDFSDRWRWVERGIELLRDDGLRYNPNDVLIHRELAWFFQHKMGANLDDANMFYKQEWADEMMNLFGPEGTNVAQLLQPQNTNAVVLREKYKMDPAFVQQVNEKYGPFDWRLPEAHAIYWGAAGLDAAAKNPDKVKADDLITLRRIIYQSMLQAFHHGRIIANPFTHTYSIGPNLDLTAKVNDAYEEMMRDDAQMSQHISLAHRNFLRDAVYFLYEDCRMAEADKWFKVLGERYPNKPIIDADTNSFPKNVTLDEYAVARTQEDIGETSQERVTMAMIGLIRRTYLELVLGHDARYQTFKRLGEKVYQRYVDKAYGYKGDTRIPLPPYDTMNRQVVTELLDQQRGLPFADRAVLRTQLGLPAETVSTNAPTVQTNAVETIPTNSAAK